MAETQEQGTKATEPLDRLKGEAKNYAEALGQRALTSLLGKVSGSAGRLVDYASGDGAGSGSGLISAVTSGGNSSPGRAVLGAAGKAVGGMLGGGGGGGSGGQTTNLKVTNIEEEIDVGVPVRLAYDQWTKFTDFPSFMKKVESVEQDSDEKLKWRAQILWSHRDWESTIKRQVPDDRIIWTSKGQKGHVDGSVSFHPLGPNLTRILLVLEYYPQGGFEYIGNLWRAQGRRARLELKHFRRHVMTQAVLQPDEVQGWRGEIEDGEVVKDQETALQEEQNGEGTDASDEYADDYGDEDEDQGEDEDEYPDEEEE